MLRLTRSGRRQSWRGDALVLHRIASLVIAVGSTVMAARAAAQPDRVEPGKREPREPAQPVKPPAQASKIDTRTEPLVRPTTERPRLPSPDTTTCPPPPVPAALPGQARGLIAGMPEESDSLAREVARTLLWPVKLAVLAATAPVRGALLLDERYAVHERVYRVFFNDLGTFGAYPLALAEIGLGLNVGGRLIWRDILGSSESMRLRASFGGPFAQLYTAQLSTGRRFGAVEFGLSGELSRRDRDLFYGIGNGEEAVPPMPVPALSGQPAVRSRFRQDLMIARGHVNVRLAPHWTVYGITSVDRRRFSDTEISRHDAPTIAEAYDRTTVVGFDTGMTVGAVDFELRYDSRRAGSAYQPPIVPSAGVLAAVSAGYNRGLGGGNWEYVRYGADAQLFLGFPADARVLVLRALVDGVTGAYEDIPFVDLPRLGGSTLLRGYQTGRFRDRVAVLASVEYSWALSGGLYGFTFVDAGRVQPSFDDISLDNARVGFGGGIHAYRMGMSLGRLQLSTSIDGGFFVQLVFDNLFDPRARRELR